MRSNPGFVVVRERYTRNPPKWERRIADGPWREMDLSPFGGTLPVVWLNPHADWVEQEARVDPLIAVQMKLLAESTAKEK